MTDSPHDKTPPGAAPPEHPLEGDEMLARYLLQIADDAMVYCQRVSEWISNAPQIEEDMAMANIALDYIGQVRPLYTRAGELDGTGRDEDEMAYFRGERDYYNTHLVEQERGDFADEMARLLWFSAYQFELYTDLQNSADEVLAGVARKAIKEVTYHRDHAVQWVLRLGDGTEESHRRMQAALEHVGRYIPELFVDDAVSMAATEAGVGILPSSIQDRVTAFVRGVVERATLEMPTDNPRIRSRGGRDGLHSKPLGYLLAEFQHIARSYPGARW